VSQNNDPVDRVRTKTFFSEKRKMSTPVQPIVMPDHPVQPLIRDQNGTKRFKENGIVRYLLDAGPFDMNQLAMMPFSREDRSQFAQLIGYSLSGFGDLSYVTDEEYARAEGRG
jgi:hypothetical protein